MHVRVAATKRQGEFLLDADFTITGERIGIFGKSGSGKSTLVSLIAGLQQPDTGEITLDGECLFSHSGNINIPVEQRRIAIVFQHSCLFPHLSVKANLLYGYRRSSAEHRRIDPDTLIEALEIGDLLTRGVNNLSGGEKQRIALGRAVLANPRLLLMDEPLSALDDALRFQIIPYLKKITGRFGIPYLFISHSMVEMRLMAEQVLVADGGAITEVTTTEQLARNRMGKSTVGYINLLRLTSPRPLHGLFAYRWGDGELLISNGGNEPEALFELSSKDIILFKRHPEAISARNLLKSTVLSTFTSGNRVGIELLSGGERLIAEVVSNAVEELGIKTGSELYAAVKASAFRRLR